VPHAVETVVFAPDDGWRYHPKHVDQFPEINKLCIVAPFWLYIRNLEAPHPGKSGPVIGLYSDCFTFICL